MTEIQLLRSEAARCRQFALLVVDTRVERTLLQMAEECDCAAEQIECDNQRRAQRLRKIIYDSVEA